MTFIFLLILVVFAGLAWRDLKFALTLLIALAPTYLLRFEIGIPWTVLEGMIVIAFAIWLVKHTEKGLGQAPSPSSGQSQLLRDIFGPYAWPLAFLMLIATLSILWAPDKLAALGIWRAYFIEPTLVFVMLRATFNDRQDWLRALTGLGVTTMFIAAFAIFQKLTGLGLPIPWDVERRATSIFPYPNAVGLFVAPIVTAIAVGAGFSRSIKPAHAVLVCAMGVTAIMLAETEAALVAIPIALVMTVLMSNLPTKRKIMIALGSLVLGALVFAGMPAIREKILLQDYSGGVRRAQWGETVELLKDRPVTGAGLSGYPTALEPYHDPRLYEIFQYPHNIILNFWVELGIFGVIALVWLAIVTGKITWAKRDDALALAAAAALLTMCIHGLVDVPFFKNDLAVLTAFFLAMTLKEKA